MESLLSMRLHHWAVQLVELQEESVNFGDYSNFSGHC